MCGYTVKSVVCINSSTHLVMALLLNVRGGGNNGWGFGGSWPACKLEIYDDKLVFKALWQEQDVPLDKILYVERMGGIPILADGVYIKYQDEYTTKFISFFPFTKSGEIVALLKKLCKNLQPTIKWYENPFKLIRIVAWPGAALVILNFFFHFM